MLVEDVRLGHVELYATVNDTAAFFNKAAAFLRENKTLVRSVRLYKASSGTYELNIKWRWWEPARAILVRPESFWRQMDDDWQRFSTQHDEGLGDMFAYAGETVAVALSTGRVVRHLHLERSRADHWWVLSVHYVALGAPDNAEMTPST